MRPICFFIPKYNKGNEFYKSENAIYLPYSEMVKSIVLEDTLGTIGMKGFVEVSNLGGVLNGIFERHNNFYLVINFTEKVSQDKTIKYEPYIFDISSVETISKISDTDKIVRIYLEDIFTSILKSHSIASFIKMTGNDVVRSKNYKILFTKIVDYVKNYIKVNTSNYFELLKDVHFGEETMLNGGEKLNGYDKDVDVSALVFASFNKVPRNASIWEAL